MSDTVLVTLIKTMPGLLWVLFAAVVFLVLRRPLVQQLSRLRAANTPFGSFDFEVALDLVERAAESRRADGGAPSPDTSSRAEQRAVATRLEYAATFLDGGRILWVDDNADGNASLIAIFERAGMSVHTAHPTDAGLAALRDGHFDLIITDMARDNDTAAGFHLADQLTVQGVRLPIILFTLGFDPRQGVHPGLFAYTASHHELIHLVIDVMERLRLGAVDGRRLADYRPPSLPRQSASR
jgi:CheY-like chemotaxis protein